MSWPEFLLVLFIGIFFAVIVHKLISAVLKWQGKKYQPDKASTFTCEDGHVVRSKGEMIIDNWLLGLGIPHIYEKTIKVHGHSIKYDWFLPESESYIEYWGFGGKTYMDRKKEKLRLYKEGHLHLISIEDKDLENIYEVFPRKFNRPATKNPLASPKIGFCPHCGEKLDERF